MHHTIFYDADCPLCQREMARTRAANRSGSLALLPVQGNEPLLKAHNISRDAALTLIHALHADGTVLRGMPALRLMYRECEGRRLHRIWNWPLLRPLADRFYPLLARHRYRLSRWLLPHATCASGTCHRPPRSKP